MRSDFIEKVKRAVFDFKMTENSKTVVCALSGGADSVSLLRALKALQTELGITVRACHLNHGLRGAESDSDERFCVDLCGRLEIPITTRKVNVGELRSKHESVEETARRVRYDFFAEILKEDGTVLATAHTANDNAETVMINLIRGTGLSGLCGIPPVRGRIIRPLICCERADVEEYLKSLGQNYVTDNSNFSEEYTRNKVRIRLLPEIMKINPSAVRTISAMTSVLRSDSDFLEELADKALNDNREGRGWNAFSLSKLPKPIRSRAVRKILMSGGVEPSSLRINTAAALLGKRSARYNPCKDRFFTIRKGICFVEKIHQNFNGFNENKFHNL